MTVPGFSGLLLFQPGKSGYGKPMNSRLLIVLLAMGALGAGLLRAQSPVPPPSSPRLPLATVFKGEAKFHAIVAKAERENWRQPAARRAHHPRGPRNGRHALCELHAGGGRPDRVAGGRISTAWTAGRFTRTPWPSPGCCATSPGPTSRRTCCTWWRSSATATASAPATT